MAGPEHGSRKTPPPDQRAQERSHPDHALTQAQMPTLREGGRGDAVKTLQQELAQEGISVAVDGRFGPATEAAVERFQRKAGIAIDGVVGPETWKRLLDDNAVAADVVTPEGRRADTPRVMFGDWRDAAAAASGGDPKFQAMMAFVRRWEGGYTVDHAGPTNYGVTQPFYDQYIKDAGRGGAAKPVARLTEAEAIAVYHAQTWNKAGVAEVAGGAERARIPADEQTHKTSTTLLAVALGNGAVNYGPSRASRFMNEAFEFVGIADGGLGQRAEAAAERGAVQEVLKRYLELEEQHYRTLGEKAKYERFLTGWLNRHESLKRALQSPLVEGVPSGLLEREIP